MVGAVVPCVMTQRWSMPSTSLEWILLIVTGQVIVGNLTARPHKLNSLMVFDHVVIVMSVKLQFNLDAGISAYGSQMSQTIALKLVDASLATAMSYLSVVWGIMSGYLVFGEVSGSVTTCLAKFVSSFITTCLKKQDYCT